MQIITVGRNDFLLQVPSCPLDILDGYYSFTFIEHGRYKLGLIPESSISKNLRKNLRKILLIYATS